MPGSRLVLTWRRVIDACSLGLVARLALLAIGVFVGSRTAAAAPLDPHGTDWEGLSQLVSLAREELGADRVVLSTQLDLDRLEPSDALLIVHPERELDADELFAFVDAGGRIALLDDFGSGDRLLSALGARRVSLPEYPSSMLRSNPSLCVAESIGVHPLVRDVTRVVTNHATGIAGGPLRPLLVVRGKPEPVVLAGASVMGTGRIVVLGDSSIAINSMLRYPGNRSLASALLTYCGPAGRSAGGAGVEVEGKLYLLVNDFGIRGHFHRAARTWRTAAEAALGRMANAAKDALQKGVPPAGTYFAAMAVGIGVVVWTATRAGRTYRGSMPGFVRPVPLTLQGGLAGHAAALASTGALRETALRELKIAVEEQLATRLGLESVVPRDVLVARVRTAGLLDDDRALSLGTVLERLSRLVARFAMPRLAPLERVRDAEMRSTARAVRALLAAVDERRRGTVRNRP